MINHTKKNNKDFSIFFDNKERSVEKIQSYIEQSIEQGAKGITLLLGIDYISDFETLNEYFTSINIPISGGVFPEVIHENTYYKDAVIAIAWDTEVEINTYKNISDPTTELYQQATSKEDVIQSGNSGCLVFVDAKTRSPEEALDALYYRSENDYQYAGAGAGYSFDEQFPCIICNDGIIKDALQTIRLSLHQENKVSYGWTVLSGPHLVTSSEKNKIYSLDYLPIEEQYRKFIQNSINEDISNLTIKDLLAKYPIGIYHYDEYMIVRDPFEFRDKAIEFFGDIPEFSNIYILTAKHQELIDETEDCLNLFNTNTINCNNSLTLLFSCVGRRNFMGENSNRELSNAVEQLSTQHSVIGTCSFGEIATNDAGLLRFHTLSLVVSGVYQ